MAVRTIGNSDCFESIGASFRPCRRGPECDLVEQFLERCVIKIPRGCKVTVFREPRIESGFPDLVLVVWHVATAQQWHPLRAQLDKDAIRLMHYLAVTGPTSCKGLENIFTKKKLKSLEYLQESDMIRKTGEMWIAKPLSKSFAARHIIAVEAKISEWGRALEQAHLNTWFASSSYIMVPRIPKASRLVFEAQSLGIGIKVLDEPTLDCRSASTQRLPLSYASWLFNEWAWRAETKGVSY